ncbi:hypothetical protein D3C78_1434560 [compost metagenome]
MRLHFIHNRFERIILIFIGLVGMPLHFTQEVQERLAALRLVAHRQRTDEHTDQALCIPVRSACYWSTYDNILLICIFGQQHIVGGQQHHKQRSTSGRSQFLQLLQQLLVRLEIEVLACQAANGWSNVIRRQL